MSDEKLTGAQIAEEAPAGWAFLLGGLQTRLHTGSFATGLAVASAIGAIAEELDHHPDLDLRYTHLDVRMTSHDVGGVTARDIRLARAVTGIAGDAGVELECATVSRLELALDTPDHTAVLPFWKAVLAFKESAGDEVTDPFDVLPAVWFQGSGSEEPRQRWHPDVWVDPAQVQPRIDAALAAGGTLVTDEFAPDFWVLADPDGNRMCLCTWQGRG
ncbi:4a-hydroxytetrahydrobiopterin dehydratase [Nocardioides caldifontis]|uniref:4a-hydroxytetrahydrobiopterin dehydratase n=1 Tax=Nocardioides caldifontis TaxID=2588938 RepID=UPI0011DF4636|nr:4a-hydroxytetrahydrobiopterin dehydratase [Nocardioides caldifontis]